MKTFIVSCIETRQFHVSYKVEACDEESASREVMNPLGGLEAIWNNFKSMDSRKVTGITEASDAK